MDRILLARPSELGAHRAEQGELCHVLTAHHGAPPSQEQVDQLFVTALLFFFLNNCCFFLPFVSHI